MSASHQVKKLSPNQIKVLKTFHLLFSGVWLSCVILLLALPLLVNKFASGDDLYLFNRIYHFIDLAILSPAAVGTLLTGLIYSWKTSWGFFKHGWLVYKWIITVLIVGLGTFYLGPMVSTLLLIASEKKMMALSDDYYVTGQMIGLWAAAINTVLLIIAVIFSVFKPKFK